MTYVQDNSKHASAFDISAVPKVSREQAHAEVAQTRSSALDVAGPSTATVIAPASPIPSAKEAQSSYAAQLSAIPEFEPYGPVLKSSAKPIELTESETEYVVTAVKHVFRKHVVFQFNVANTIPDTVLEQVAVIMQPSPDCGLIEDFIIPIDSLTTQIGQAPIYVSFTRENPQEYAAGSFGCTLKFVSKEVDPSNGQPEEEGYDDEYQLEELDLGAADVSASVASSCSDIDINGSISLPPSLLSWTNGTS